MKDFIIPLVTITSYVGVDVLTRYEVQNGARFDTCNEIDGGLEFREDKMVKAGLRAYEGFVLLGRLEVFVVGKPDFVSIFEECAKF